MLELEPEPLLINDLFQQLLNDIDAHRQRRGMDPHAALPTNVQSLRSMCLSLFALLPTEDKTARMKMMWFFLNNLIDPDLHGRDQLVICTSICAIASLCERVPPRRLHRGLVDELIKPVLVQFCDAQRPPPPGRIYGLLLVIRLFPQLFNQTFGEKVLDLLDFLAANVPVLGEDSDFTSTRPAALVALSPPEIIQIVQNILEMLEHFSPTRS